jgi:hypothetical protein
MACEGRASPCVLHAMQGGRCTPPPSAVQQCLSAVVELQTVHVVSASVPCQSDCRSSSDLPCSNACLACECASFDVCMCVFHAFKLMCVASLLSASCKNDMYARVHECVTGFRMPAQKCLHACMPACAHARVRTRLQLCTCTLQRGRVASSHACMCLRLHEARMRTSTPKTPLPASAAPDHARAQPAPRSLASEACAYATTTPSSVW